MLKISLFESEYLGNFSLIEKTASVAHATKSFAKVLFRREI